MPVRVQVGSRVVEFPDGTPEAEMRAALDSLPSDPVPSHGPVEARPIATGGGRGTGLDVRKSNQWASDNAPAIGATLATTATGGGALPLMLAAGLGGASGSALRGDSGEEIALQGALQAGLQGAPAVLKRAAPTLYRTVVPKAVQDKFPQADLAAKGLKDRVLLGTKGGTKTALRSSKQAGNTVRAAADDVPAMSGRDVQEAFKPSYNEALIGGKPRVASDIGSHVQDAMREMAEASGQTGGQFTGRQQLARKKILERQAKPAMQADNRSLAPVNAEYADIEREAIARNLRRSPAMREGLNESQAAVGMTKAAKATQNSSLVNRLTSGGGIWNSLRSPAGISGTAIGMNELANIPFPELVRLAQMAQLGQDE